MPHSITLCTVDDIDEGTSKGFTIGELSLFAVKSAGKVYLYQNRCPHAGLPLNWLADKFLDRDGELILCASHGALFDITSGRCVTGPCKGRHLKAIDYVVEDGNLVLLHEM